LKPNPYLLSESSLDLVSRIEIGKQKIVVTGASGWLGQTFVSLANREGHELLLIGSHSRDVVIDGRHIKVHSYEIEAIKRFAPTVVIDFAFVTRNHLVSIDNNDYRAVNEKLISQALTIFKLPSVLYGMFTSSGAAVYPKDALLEEYSQNPYGFLKRKTEEIVTSTSYNLAKKAIVIRPWSLSGTMVTKDNDYAFSSFIRQSFTQKIHVKSTISVYRRYVAAEDFLALALAKLFSSTRGNEIFDSGGELTSLVELAQKIANGQNHKVKVVSAVSSAEEGDRYYSDNKQWEAECESYNFQPETLAQQVARNILFSSSINNRFE
jgi:nucleoside-diphosphate-sugar epimerase